MLTLNINSTQCTEAKHEDSRIKECSPFSSSLYTWCFTEQSMQNLAFPVKTEWQKQEWLHLATPRTTELKNKIKKMENPLNGVNFHSFFTLVISTNIGLRNTHAQFPFVPTEDNKDRCKPPLTELATCCWQDHHGKRERFPPAWP